MSSKTVNYQYVFTLPSNEEKEKDTKRSLLSQFTLQQYGSGDINLRSTGSQKVHAQYTCLGLDNLRTKGVLCDVKLKVDGREIIAHRNVLAVHSDYFMAMFTAGLEESRQESIQMHGVTYEGLRACVDFIYTGSIHVHKDCLQDVVVSSDLLQMKDLKEGCAHVLMTYLDSANCIGFWLFGIQYSCRELCDMAILYIKKRFLSVIGWDEFLDLEAESVAELLILNDISLGSHGEDVIVRALLKWLEKDESRHRHTGMLFDKVRLKHISQECKDKIRNSNILIDSIPDLISKLDEAAESAAQKRHHEEQIYVAGGFLQSRTGPVCPKVKTAEVYSPWEDKWRQTWLLPVQACTLYAFSFMGRLLCVVSEAGEDGNPAGVTLLEFDLIQERWEPITEGLSTDALKQLHHTLRCGGSIYFSDWNHRLYTCTPHSFGFLHVEEKASLVAFSPGDSLSPVPNPVEDTMRVDNALVCHKGDVYSIGGSIQYSKTQVRGTADVFAFAVGSSSWIQKASMNEARSCLAVTTHGNFVYAVGGFSQMRLSSVECLSIATGQWTIISAMNKHRSHACCVSLGDHIYVMGGKSYADNFQCGGARKVLRSCERYDVTKPNSGWNYIEDMDTARCLFAAATF